MMKNGYGSSSIKFLGIYHPTEKNHLNWFSVSGCHWGITCLASASVLKGYDSPRLRRGMLLQALQFIGRLEGLIFTNSFYFMW